MTAGDQQAAKKMRQLVEKGDPKTLSMILSVDIDPKLVGKRKVASGKYLTALQAYLHWKQDPKRTNIVDVRSRYEYVYVGHPKMARNIPLKRATGGWTINPLGLELKYNDRFIESVKRFYQPDDKIFVICRSGHRSVAAISMLVDTGYKNVVQIVDGFEGAKVSKRTSPDYGLRKLNGWKNSGIPWSYDLRLGLIDE